MLWLSASAFALLGWGCFYWGNKRHFKDRPKELAIFSVKQIKAVGWLMIGFMLFACLCLASPERSLIYAVGLVMFTGTAFMFLLNNWPIFARRSLLASVIIAPIGLIVGLL